MEKIKYFSALIIFVLAVLSCSLCKDSRTLKSGTKVTYKVSGTVSTADVTVMNEKGKFETYDDVTLPWEKTYYVKKGNVSVAAVHPVERGVVKVAIYIDGMLMKEDECEANKCIAVTSDWVK